MNPTGFGLRVLAQRGGLRLSSTSPGPTLRATAPLHTGQHVG